MTNLYKIPQEWTNYGDANPERHGGLFVKWDNGMWHCVQTTHFADLPKDMTDNEHMFEDIYVEPMDIWKNGNPYDGFTKDALKFFGEYSTQPFNVTNDPDLPENETYKDYVNFYLQNEIEWIISTFIFSFVGYYHANRKTDFAKDYWGYLETYGIEKENF